MLTVVFFKTLIEGSEAHCNPFGPQDTSCDELWKYCPSFRKEPLDEAKAMDEETAKNFEKAIGEIPQDLQALFERIPPLDKQFRPVLPSSEGAEEYEPLLILPEKAEEYFTFGWDKDANDNR
ncbi:unnamed protein product, partial [Prorocentrum cordatum]